MWNYGERRRECDGGLALDTLVDGDLAEGGQEPGEDGRRHEFAGVARRKVEDGDGRVDLVAGGDVIRDCFDGERHSRE
jgi:hypothetical protein